MLDPGAANKSHLFKQLCDRLQVKLQINKPGNARAKGQVENAHNLIERHFEGRLRFMPELDLDGLNALCERWQAAHNSGRKHSRHGQPRYSMWMAITPEQLRIAPPLQMMRDLVTTAEETRRVSNAMTVSYSVKGYGSADYSVAYVPGALAGQTVKVCVNPYRAPAIDVQYVDKATGEISWVCIEPIKLNAAGFQVDAPVIGEQFKALPHTVADKARGELLMQAQNVSTLEEAEKARKRHAQAYAGHLDAMADVDSTPVPAYLPRRGTALETEKRAVAAVRLTVVEVMKRLKPLLGDYPAKDAYAWLQARFGEEGVPEDQLEAIAAQITGVELRQADAALREENADAPLPALRLVGGAR